LIGSKSEKLRALFDANLLISFLINPDPSRSAVAALFHEAESKSFTLIVPIEAYDEAALVVATKPWLSARVTVADLAKLAEFLDPIVEHIPALTEPPTPVSRDPRDDYLLAQGIQNGVNVIVTRDNDLLSLDDPEGVRILDPPTFLAFLRARR
jgi:putative PIN family toxin of toxin-antitoxin system